MRPRIPVFYSEAMAVASHAAPVLAKAREVVTAWQDRGFPVQVFEPEPATRDELCRAHDPYYVDGILNCERDNAFDNRDPQIAAALPWAVGSLLTAARHALKTRGVTVSPASGFSHAGFEEPAGGCTFNGFVVTALALQAEGLARRVGILDFNHAQGEGTDAILKRLKLDWVAHYSAGRHYEEPSQAEAFLRAVPGLVNRMADCDLLLYQAGADPHLSDPLGGWLSTEQLRARDRLVFTTAKLLGIPIAWNFGGGYLDAEQTRLEIHDNTLRECVAAYAQVEAA